MLNSFPSRLEDDEESSLPFPNPSYSNYIHVTSGVPIMQTSNDSILENTPNVGGIVPTGPPSSLTLSYTAPHKVTVEHVSSSQLSVEGTNHYNQSIHIHPEKIEQWDEGNIHTVTEDQVYASKDVAGGLVQVTDSDPHDSSSRTNRFDEPSTCMNIGIARSQDAISQLHDIEAIHDLCPTPEYHNLLISGAFGYVACSCHLGIKVRPSTVQTVKRFRCVQCNVGFTDKKNAKRHVKSFNNPVECFKCKLWNGALKEELDFQGIVVGDWAAMINCVQVHLIFIAWLQLMSTGDHVHLLLACNGLSQHEDARLHGIWPQSARFVPTTTTTSWWGSNLMEAINHCSVSIKHLKDMVTHSMAALFELGQDNGYPALNFDYSTEDTFSGGTLVNEHIK
ncbi:hypothetical protein BU17DRAFT_80932 [Hysterangium stoloniferum]|nr:hypothetical protein BU17DRAFT_80932 [Hysterangium stoloniferum]